MFQIENVFRNITRNKGKSIISLTIVFVLSVFILIYSGFLSRQEAELRKMSEDAFLELVFCNIAGTQQTGICINTDKMDKVIGSGLVEPEDIVTRVLYSEELETKGRLREGRGNYLHSASGFNRDNLVSNTDITYLDSYDGSFFEGNEYLCIMKKSCMEELGLSLGDEFEREYYNIAERTSSNTSYYCGNHKFKIIGYYENMDVGEIPSNCTFICPFQTLRDMAEEHRVHTWPTSARFKLKSPDSINKLTKVLEEAKITEVMRKVNSKGKYGNTAFITDGTFIRTSEPIIKNVNLLKSLYLPIFAIAVFIGFLSSFLLMQSRKGEIAIRRSLGTSGKEIFFSMIFENVMISFAAGIIALVLVFIFADINAEVFASLIALIAMYLLGTSVAVISLLRTNVIAVLTSE